MKASQIREKNTEEIRNLLLDTRKEYMEMRFQMVSGQLTDTSKLPKSRKLIAQLETILKERALTENKEGEK